MNKILKQLGIMSMFLLLVSTVYAQDASSTPMKESSMWSSPMFWIFVFAIIGLLLVIVAIGSVLVGLVNKKISDKFGKGATIITAFIMLMSSTAFAQDATGTTAPADANAAVTAILGGLDPNTVIIFSL